MRKLLLTVLFAWTFTSFLFAQWECPSQLAAYLKPIGKSNLYWSSELTGGTGYLTNNLIGNGMALVGLDWSSGKSTFYAEGGFKYWNRYNRDDSQDYSNQHAGIRELYYQYKANQGSLTVGIHSARLDDDFLLNERVAGANLRINRGKWSMNLLGGTVTKDFARNGTFCNVGYLYNIFPERQRALIGNEFGQTNMASFSLKYQPGKTGKTKASEDEFSSDEFSDKLDKNKVSNIKLESVGAVLYHEFGGWVSQSFVSGGLFAQAEWGNGWYFKPEILFQSATNNRAVIYNFHLEKSFEGEKNRTSISLRYVGKTNIDTDAHILNSFSNIFAGDVIRLDAIDASFIQAGIKYNFPESKIHLKAQFASQLTDNNMKECDFEIGKKFGKHLQINALSGMAKSSLLSNDAFLGRIEFRYYF